MLVFGLDFLFLVVLERVNDCHEKKSGPLFAHLAQVFWLTTEETHSEHQHLARN